MTRSSISSIGVLIFETLCLRQHIRNEQKILEEFSQINKGACCIRLVDKYDKEFDSYYHTYWPMFKIDDEICYYERMEENRRYSFLSSMDLNLPIPFKVGDIITLDCLPFAPVKHAVIIEITNAWDCCGVRILYRQKHEINGKDEWAAGALKHGHGWNSYYPLLSPLYRLSSFTGELLPEERLMTEVQKFVRQDSENGDKLEEFVHESEPDDNELSAYLRKQSL